jgi:predicted nucleic acid-binding protein
MQRPRPLASFDGDVLYLDAMILEGFLRPHSQWHAASRQLFERALDAARPIRLVTATLTIDEVVFVVLQELLLEPPYTVARSRSQYLSEHPVVVQELMAAIRAPVGGLLQLLALEPVTASDVADMTAEMAASGVLPRDAIHVAVMRRLGVTAIASDDDAFCRCAGIVLFKP